MLTINLEPNVKYFLPLTELVKIYIRASDKAYIPRSESYRDTMYRLLSTVEIENGKKRHENIVKMFGDDEASGLLNVIKHAGDRIVLLDDLIRWADVKNIKLNQEGIRGKKSHLELADERVQEQDAKNSLKFIPSFDAELPILPVSHGTPPIPKDVAGVTRRERQILAIEAAIKKLGYSALAIPTGGKKKVEQECRSSPELFGVGVDPFKEAWHKAVKLNRVRTVMHAKYARRED
jgi:hypothetical protein